MVYLCQDIYKVVPREDWMGWSRQAKAVFNLVYRDARDQKKFRHPQLNSLVRLGFWEHTRYTIAHAAAEAVMKTEKLTTMVLNDPPEYWKRRTRHNPRTANGPVGHSADPDRP